jgi:hypothetical protein
MAGVPTFPPEPDVPPEQRAAGQVPLRYEDISQDGRVKLLTLPHTSGPTVWQQALRPSAIVQAQHAGVVPILTRLVMEGGGGPVSVRKPLEVTGCYALCHTVDQAGEVNRLILNIWVDVHAPLARTHGPPPPRAGELVRVGRCFAEHVITRPFADRAHRKVLRFDLEGLPPVPPARWTFRPPEEVLELPAGARALDAEPVGGGAPCLFGQTHTDANQHVNALTYPRLFEEAALERLAAHGRPATLLASSAVVGYRKPCFAGDRMRILVRAFELPDGTAGVVGAFVREGDPARKPHCTVRMLLT